MICAALITLLGGCKRGSSQEPDNARPNVVVIAVDTLRADRLGCYGFEPARTPHIDKLAAQGVRDKASFLVPDEAVTLALQDSGLR